MPYPSTLLSFSTSSASSGVTSKTCCSHIASNRSFYPSHLPSSSTVFANPAAISRMQSQRLYSSSWNFFITRLKYTEFCNHTPLSLPTGSSANRLFRMQRMWFSKSSLSDALHFFNPFPLFYASPFPSNSTSPTNAGNTYFSPFLSMNSSASFASFNPNR